MKVFEPEDLGGVALAESKAGSVVGFVGSGGDTKVRADTREATALLEA